MLTDLLEQLGEEGKIFITVRVHAHAAKTQFVNILEDGSLKIDVAAPAENGKGNEVLARHLAVLFKVPVPNVKILSGKTGRVKLVRIVGMHNEQLTMNNKKLK